MTISIGDRLPDASFRTPTPDGPANVTAAELFAGKTVVLFAVPGAFTPVCQGSHLPGYIADNEAIRAKGVDTIAVVAVNDVFVMKAWAAATASEDKIVFLADGNADFARALGLEADLTTQGFGVRSKRYSMIVKDRIVVTLNVEEEAGAADVSSAEFLLRQI